MGAVEYCCCAIPLVNAGIYLTLIEHVVASVLVGILAIKAPSIVGASTPSFASWTLAGICFCVAALQLLGFFGVVPGKQETTGLFRQYVKLHGLAILAGFSVAAIWIVVSTIRHPYAQTKCIQDFFGPTTTSGGSDIQNFFGSVTAIQGEVLCDLFPWVDVVIMGVLAPGPPQLYLFVILRSTLACHISGSGGGPYTRLHQENMEKT